MILIQIIFEHNGYLNFFSINSWIIMEIFFFLRITVYFTYTIFYHLFRNLHFSFVYLYVGVNAYKLCPTMVKYLDNLRFTCKDLSTTNIHKL